MDATTPPPWANGFAYIQEYINTHNLKTKSNDPRWIEIWKPLLPLLRDTIIVNMAFKINEPRVYEKVITLASGNNTTPYKLDELAEFFKRSTQSRQSFAKQASQPSAQREKLAPYWFHSKDITTPREYGKFLYDVISTYHQNDEDIKRRIDEFIAEVKAVLISRLYENRVHDKNIDSIDNDLTGEFITKINGEFHTLNKMYENGNIPIPIIEQIVKLNHQ